MNKLVVATSIALGLLLAGCNTSANQVEATYIDAIKHKEKTCRILKRDYSHVTQKVESMKGVVDAKKSSQDTKLAFGWLFWPSYLIIDDNKEEAKQLATLKGEFVALTSAMDEKECTYDKTLAMAN